VGQSLVEPPVPQLEVELPDVPPEVGQADPEPGQPGPGEAGVAAGGAAPVGPQLEEGGQGRLVHQGREGRPARLQQKGLGCRGQGREGNLQLVD
jgi:hypothetical protein